MQRRILCAWALVPFLTGLMACSAPVCYISTHPISLGMCGGVDLDSQCNP